MLAHFLKQLLAIHSTLLIPHLKGLAWFKLTKCPLVDICSVDKKQLFEAAWSHMTPAFLDEMEDLSDFSDCTHVDGGVFE